MTLARGRSRAASLRDLGLVRISFIACFTLFYSVLVLFSFFTQTGAHERFRLGDQKTEDSQLSSLLLEEADAFRSGFMIYAPPGDEHWLGTDEFGRDVFTRLAYGARTSLAMGCISLITFLLAGVGFGVVAGFFEGKWRSLVLYLFSLVNTFPILLLLLLAVIVIDGVVDSQWLFMRIYILMAVFGLFSSPKLAELIRGRISSLKETAFVNAAVALGLSPAQIIFKHILWYECRPLILVQSAYMMGQAILVETTLTYLNFGLEYPLVSWGLMLRTMASGIFTGKIQVLVVMAMIALSVFFFQYLAALLNDILARKQGDID